MIGIIEVVIYELLQETPKLWKDFRFEKTDTKTEHVQMNDVSCRPFQKSWNQA